eukprot:RCo051825
MARYRGFKEGVIRVLVCSAGFGQGVDLPRVQFVIHSSMPQSLTAYYQQVGRGGRDPQTSCRCVLLADPPADRFYFQMYYWTLLVRAAREIARAEVRAQAVSSAEGAEGGSPAVRLQAALREVFRESQEAGQRWYLRWAKWNQKNALQIRMLLESTDLVAASPTATTPASTGSLCFRCNRPGHFAKDCRGALASQPPAEAGSFIRNSFDEAVQALAEVSPRGLSSWLPPDLAGVEHELQELDAMMSYIELGADSLPIACRRKFLLQHFAGLEGAEGGDVPVLVTGRQCCDLCQAQPQSDVITTDSAAAVEDELEWAQVEGVSGEEGAPLLALEELPFAAEWRKGPDALPLGYERVLAEAQEVPYEVRYMIAAAISHNAEFEDSEKLPLAVHFLRHLLPSLQTTLALPQLHDLPKDALLSACEGLYLDLLALRFTVSSSAINMVESEIVSEPDPLTGAITSSSVTRTTASTTLHSSSSVAGLSSRFEAKVRRRASRPKEEEMDRGWTRYCRVVVQHNGRLRVKPMKEDISSRLLRFFGPESLLRVTFQDRSLLLTQGFLRNPTVRIAGRTFRGVCFISPTGLREAKLWMVCEDYRNPRLANPILTSSCEIGPWVRGLLGHFIPPPPPLRSPTLPFPPGRYCAQLGLLCSQAFPTVRIPTKNLHQIPDVVRDGFCFTDGVGVMGSGLADQIRKVLGLPFVPSALQFRLRGMKGVATVLPPGTMLQGAEGKIKVDTLGLYYRPSQVKFSTAEDAPEELAVFHVCESGYSRPLRGVLDRQKLNLLVALWGHAGEAAKARFEGFVRAIVCGDLTNITEVLEAACTGAPVVGDSSSSPSARSRLLSEFCGRGVFRGSSPETRLSARGSAAACTEEAEEGLVQRTLGLLAAGHDCRDPWLGLMLRLHYGNAMEYMDKRVTIVKSRTVYGVADETGLLKEGEVYLAISPNLHRPGPGRRKVITGPLAVTKN